MKKMLKNLKANVKGAALVEYGILVGLIAVLAISAVLALGNTVAGTFSTIENELSTQIASATS